MNKVISALVILFATISLDAQDNRASVLQDLEKNQSAAAPANQDALVTATLKSASRLFGAKDDLTTVIMVIPNGSDVEILDSDSTYYKVKFEDYEGFILRRHAIINEAVTQTSKAELPEPEQTIPDVSAPAQQQYPGEQKVSRFTYLENKYGTSMASKLMAGKIWKGMNAEMISDSWGSPRKINRVISGNTVKEEWIFKNTWLYIEDDVLRDWGAIK